MSHPCFRSFSASLACAAGTAALVAAFATLAPTSAGAEPTAPPTAHEPVLAKPPAGATQIVAPGGIHGPIRLGAAPFDIIVDLQFPPPPTATPQPPPTSTPNPTPTFVEAPRYNVGLACSQLTIVLAKVVAYQGQPGGPQAVITAPLGSITPVSSTNVGLGCVASFSGVPRDADLIVGTRRKGQPIANVPIGGWSNPFSVKTTDPTSAATGHQFRELSIALPPGA